MVQTCSKCSRANPTDAVYCYYDGFVLEGHSRNGGPLAVGAQSFANPFVFPTGRQCRSFDELAKACQDEWESARDLLQQGYLESFLGGLGRIDLAMAAKEAARSPEHDRGLDQLLSEFPTDVLAEPQLSVETQEINLGILEPGAEREFQIHLDNQGQRLLYGTVSCAGKIIWLSVGEGGTDQKHFQFTHDLSLPVFVRGDRLRAGNKPLEAVLEIESNGGAIQITVRADVPVKPFPPGLFAGAKSPRQVAEKAKANPKEAAALFENGAVAQWYKSNGWTYPVQGPSASGLGAVQQFFEALGLTPAPKVEINTTQIDLQGNAGDQLSYTIEVKSQEKRPVYAHATSNEPWLEVSRPKLNGRIATINVSVSSVPKREGETLQAKLTVQSNGNQRFIVPVTLQVGQSLHFGAPEPTAAEAVTVSPNIEPVAALDFTAPPANGAPAPKEQRRRRPEITLPAWLHLVPALLLLLAVVTAVGFDIVLKKPGGTVDNNDLLDPEKAGAALGGNWSYTLKDSDPHLEILFSDDMKFGLVMTKAPDPTNPDKFKRLTYEDHGDSNNTIVKIDNFEYHFGQKTPTNRWADRGRLKKKEIPGRRGWISTMEFGAEHVEVTQHVEIVPGLTGYLDTCLVYYTVKNLDTGKHKVGLRVMLDTYIGGNDGAPFTIPGKKGFVDTKAEFGEKQIPDYIEVVEKPDDTKDPGTVARMGLKHIKLPGLEVEDPERLLICRWPGKSALWDFPVESMTSDKENKDSCVALYWPYQNMNPTDTRRMAFTYGLGMLEVGSGTGTALALSVPAFVQPESEFVATAYVWHANKGDTVHLKVPSGLKLAEGEKEDKTIEDQETRTQVFWRLRSTGTGSFPLKANIDRAESKPKEVVVKTTSIFG